MACRRVLLALVLVAVSGLAVAAPAHAATAPTTELLVYATREGLVGQVTANGHVIVPHDQFVSLPSWNVLSPKGTGQYSVRACAVGRCVYEPVWDVGPWNTHDDYWTLPRQWPGLPAGIPEAQAAFQNGYNGGHDQYGRQVLNPAGIDLADGAVWDGLRLPAAADNAWVALTLLWTGTGTQGQVRTDGQPLNVRVGPGTQYANAGLAGPYARVPVQCQLAGQPIAGTVSTTGLWDRIGPDNYVSQAYVAVDPGLHVPWC